MKAITLHQPWASLVALGYKQVETRSWKTSYRGPLAIHASQRMRRIPDDLADAIQRVGIAEHPQTWGALLQRGVVVATCELIDVVPVEDLGITNDERWTLTTRIVGSHRRWTIRKSQLPFGDFSANRYVWVLDDIQALKKPLPPARGRQGVWEWS